MFHKNYNEAGALSCGRPTLSSNMTKTAVEHSFTRLRRQEEARRNRSTAGSGLFSRQMYRRG